MPKGIIGTYNLLSFDSRIAKSLMHSKARAILESGVKEWLRVAESQIPVWSGMSRGTLVKLASQVGVNISLFVAPGAQKPKGPGDRSSEGRAKSEGRLIIVPGRYGFEYRSDVFHLAVNENADATRYGFRLKNPGPYFFRQLADAAFNKHMNKSLSRFPWRLVIGDSFKVTSQRVG